MSIPEQYAHYVSSFFSEFDAIKAGYRGMAFHCLAIKRDDKWVIVKGAASAVINELGPRNIEFVSESVLALRVPLADLKMDFRRLLQSLLSGRIRTKFGELHFPPLQTGQYQAFHTPYHQYGFQNNHRLNVLQLTGAQLDFIPQPQTDWELKAAATPYDSLQEIGFECGVGTIFGAVGFEFVAYNVASIATDAVVEDATARPAIIVGCSLKRKDLRLSYRILRNGNVIDRGSVEGLKLRWSDAGDAKRGEASLSIPKGGVLHCTVSHKGLTQHFAWLFGRGENHNVNRAAFNAIAPISDAIDQILDPVRKGDDTRQFEVAFARVAWMLGFGVAHFGKTKSTQEGPDVLLSIGSGDIAVVEFTTGVIKADKLSWLFERTELVRQSVARATGQPVRVLPVFITTLERAGVEAGVSQAMAQGAMVLCREDIEAMIHRTKSPPQAEQIYAMWVQSVDAAKPQQEPGTISGTAYNPII